LRPWYRALFTFSRAVHILHIPADEGDVMITILIVLLVLAMLGSLPSWPYSTGWGYYPSGGLGLILLILVVLALAGRL